MPNAICIIISYVHDTSTAGEQLSLPVHLDWHGGQLTRKYRPLSILQIRWPDTITNIDLWERTHELDAGDEIRIKLEGRWGWISHILRKPASTITKHPILRYQNVRRTLHRTNANVTM